MPHCGDFIVSTACLHHGSTLRQPIETHIRNRPTTEKPVTKRRLTENITITVIISVPSVDPDCSKQRKLLRREAGRSKIRVVVTMTHAAWSRRISAESRRKRNSPSLSSAETEVILWSKSKSYKIAHIIIIIILCPRHLRYRGRGNKKLVLKNENAGMTVSPRDLPTQNCRGAR